MLLASCQDQLTEPPPQAPDGSFSISDALAGAVADRNPGFFWLPPAAPQPKSAELGTFHEGLQPAVEVVCQVRLRDGSPVPDAECDGDDVVVRYTRGDGLTEEEDHYAIHLDAGALEAGAGSETLVYRIIAYTDPLTELGGPFALGHLDFRLDAAGPRRGGASGADGDILSLSADRTLPVRFRIDRGAYEWELRSNAATVPNEPGAPLCQVNCSVTVIDPVDETEASLTDPETGEEVTAVLFPAGALDESAVLVIDERTTEGPDATCAPGYAPASAGSCFRYVITYPGEFNVDVPFGICPSEEVELGEGTLWDLVKVDYDDGEPVVSFPPSFDASPFLPCGGSTGTPIGFLHRFLDWLVPAAYAGDTRVWGGTVRDFSDILWAIDAELTMDPLPESATSGSTLPLRARWLAMHPTLHDEDPVGIEGAEVTFTVGEGGGELLPPEGVEPVDQVLDSEGRAVALTFLTDADGYAAGTWRADRVGNRQVEISYGTGTSSVSVTISPPLENRLAVGLQHTCALTPAGEPYCWGRNAAGQLGTGDTISSGSPVPVTGDLLFEEISAGGATTCARTSDGTAYCWGSNHAGQLGSGDSIPSSVPVAVVGGLLFDDIEVAGLGYACGRAGDQAYCWGRNHYGQLGTGDLDGSPVPRPVSQGGLVFRSLTVGLVQACGLTASGEAYCWGGGQFGALGTGDLEHRLAPAPVAGGHTFSHLQTGATTTCGTTTAGATYCWGTDWFGSLGSGTTDAGRQLVPMTISGQQEFVTAGPGKANNIFTPSCGVTAAGTAYCWGSNLYGALGSPSAPETCSLQSENWLPFSCTGTPQPVEGEVQFASVLPSGAFVCGVAVDGGLFCWGYNHDGQLGAVTTETCDVDGEFPAPCSTRPLAVEGWPPSNGVSSPESFMVGGTAPVSGFSSMGTEQDAEEVRLVPVETPVMDGSP